MKVDCCECGRDREPYRPIARLVDGTVTFICRQCWKALEYAGRVTDPGNGPLACTPYMFQELSADDLTAMRKFR